MTQGKLTSGWTVAGELALCYFQSWAYFHYFRLKHGFEREHHDLALDFTERLLDDPVFREMR